MTQNATDCPPDQNQPEFPWLHFFSGDVIKEEYHGSVIVDYHGTIHVVNPIQGIRFVVDLDDSKRCGYRKSLGLSYDQQIELSREYIDRMWALQQQRENKL